MDDPQRIGLEALAPGFRRTAPIGPAMVEVVMHVDEFGVAALEHVAVTFPDHLMPTAMPTWTLKGLVELVTAEALVAAQRRQLAEQAGQWDVGRWDEMTWGGEDEELRQALRNPDDPRSVEIIRDRKIRDAQDYAAALATVRRRPRITPEMLSEVLRLYEEGGIKAVMDKNGRSERTARRLLARARAEVQR